MKMVRHCGVTIGIDALQVGECTHPYSGDSQWASATHPYSGHNQWACATCPYIRHNPFIFFRNPLAGY